MMAETASEPRSGRRLRRRSPSVTMPASVPSGFTTITEPKPLRPISSIASFINASMPTIGSRSFLCMTSRTSLSRAPSLPPGWNTRKCSAVKPALFQQRDRQRVAEGELHGGGGRRRKAVRAGLVGLRQGETDRRRHAPASIRHWTSGRSAARGSAWNRRSGRRVRSSRPTRTGR